MKTFSMLILIAVAVGIAFLLRQRANAPSAATPASTPPSPFASASALTLEQSGETDTGPCEHCGHDSRLVWGYVYRGGIARAVYFVHWTLGVSEHPANFDLILGEWGNSSTPAQRVGVSLLYRNDIDAHGFMVIDSKGRRTDSPTMAGRALSRAEVVGTPLADEVFAIGDYILLNESRIRTIQTKPPSGG